MTNDNLLLLVRHCSEDVRNWLVRALLILFLAVASGCKDQPQRSQVFPVCGRLMIGSKPAEKATLYFHPQYPIDSSSLRPIAIVQADGCFRPTTYQANDGLPAGEYTVTVSWPIEIVISPGEIVSGDDRLGGRYSHLDRPVARITIVAGNNELKPIELK